MSRVIKFLFVFLTLCLSIGVNLDEGLLAHYGFDANILMATLVALLITGLIIKRRMALISLVIAMVIGINLPEEIISGWGFDQDFLLIGLIAVILVPLIMRIF